VQTRAIKLQGKMKAKKIPSHEYSNLHV